MSPMRGNMGRTGMGSTSGGVIEVLSSDDTGGTDVRWPIGARIHMGSGTQYVATDYIGNDDVIYEGKVIDDFGFASRAIPAPAGLPIIGDGKIRLDDNTREWRTLLASESGKGRLIEIVRIADGEVIGGYETTKWYFGDGWAEVHYRDLLAKPFSVQFLGLIDRTIFPYLAEGVDSDFMPMVFGNQFSSVSNPQGKVRCPHIGQTTLADTTPVDRYCMSRYKLFMDHGGATVIYRKLSGDATYSVVSAAEYVFTKSELITVNGQSWQPTYLDFLAPQAAGTQIRCDTYGLDSVSSIGSGTVNAYLDRNAIDFLSYIMKVELVSLGGDNRDDRYHEANFAAVRSAVQAAGWKMDGTIDQPITLGAFISRWCSSSEIKFFINRNYQYDVALIAEEDPDRLELTFGQDFIQFTPFTSDLSFNRWPYYFDRVSTTGEWSKQDTYNVIADQAELGNAAYQGSTPRIEAQQVYLYYVIDATTAASVIARRSNYERIGSQRAEFIIDLAPWFHRIDLGQRIGLTDPFGIGPAGWDNVEMEVLSLDDEFGPLQIHGTCVMRQPVTYGSSGSMHGGLAFLFLN